MKKMELSFLAAAIMYSVVVQAFAPQLAPLAGLFFGVCVMIVLDSVRRGYYSLLPYKGKGK